MRSLKNPLQTLLQHARKAQRLSQLELALRLDVSQRHVSFVEGGRALPSRKLLLTWLQTLNVPLAERNAALQHAGFAPVFSATPLDDPQMADVRRSLQQLLSTHDPMPALVIGHAWDLLQLNRGAQWLAQTLMPGLFHSASAEPLNMLDLLLHPQGLLSKLLNVADAGADFLTQLRGDLADQPQLAPRVDALAALLAPHTALGRGVTSEASSPLLTLRFASPFGELAFFRMFSTFGSPRDINLSSLRVEHLFAADEPTRKVLIEQVKN